ncbi:MFS general substrate transporter [Bimuria novae-zelandiae CBS 107.79]|uniref:MFS general substrate transporter n=1 Tax=Bimuria novae-zelandiae CBS 107.79 TaxID=1447943 RepID=A0A6A5UQA6_9PLEO|nr:MFS general substrate transporter [Bimuria novae-zelandiae CBS 107.79]
MAATTEYKTPIEKATPIESRHDDHLESVLKPDDLTADAVAKGQAATGYETISLWDTVKTFKVASACCFAAAFSAGADGFQMAMNASIIANKGFVQQFATDVADGKKFLAAGTISSWSATQNCGQVVGQTGISFLNARFGRKVGMYALWTLIMCSVLIETFARNWKIWLVAKLFAGMGVGAMQATILGYISEVAPVRIRGSMLMLYSFWWTVGSFFTHVALQRLNHRDPFDWLTPIYIQWGHVGLMAIIYICLPESPAWCASVGKEAQAKKWLKFIHRDVEGYDVEYQYQVRRCISKVRAHRLQFFCRQNPAGRICHVTTI